ncbi:MAG TPA: toprim domain-containing protein, partial [Fimbriimonadaceae bacterium]|nr:toprim domain-containing protein [Fimbriimonadaceae bacterium]
KYRFPKGFKKEVVLYNFHRALSHERDAGLIVVEGFFSVVKLHQAGFPNVVATMGCSVSEAQVDLLALSPSVSILFDGNEAGRSGAEVAARLLAPRVPVRLVRLPDGLEPEDVPADALRWLVGGAEAFDFSEVTFTAPPREAPAVAEPSEALPAPASLSRVAHQN